MKLFRIITVTKFQVTAWMFFSYFFHFLFRFAVNFYYEKHYFTVLQFKLLVFFQGAGTDEDALIEIICSRTPDQIEAIRKHFELVTKFFSLSILIQF